MTRVDFYILSESSGPADSLVIAACKLCEKAVGAGLKVYAHLPDPRIADDFDGALWSYRQGGFVAHERYTGTPLEQPLPTVLFGHLEPPDSHHDVLVNLATEVPDFFSRFGRVLEVVGGDPVQRNASRERYKFYRDRGYALNTFEQTASGGWTQRTAR